MAHIEKRNRGGKTSWRARYRAPDGRERSQSFAKKSDAEQWLDATRGDLAHGSYVDPAGGKKRFGEYAREWQAGRVHRPTTKELVDSHLRNHLLPKFEDRPLGSIRRSEIHAFVKELSDRLAPASVEVVYRFLASIFRSAVADRLIATTPCERIALPKLERKRAIPLETEQVVALADAVPDRYRALVVLAASTGLRQGEAFGLTVPNVDFLRRRLEVVQQLLLVQGRPPFLGPPKTDASIRTIPLPQVAIDALAEHLAKYPAGKDQFVFTNEHGNPIGRTRFSVPWRRAVKAAGAPEGTGFHALRHYYASLLIRHGESVKVVQSRLGHASAAETLDTYSHLWPDSEDRTREAVDAVLLEVSRPHRGPRSVVRRVSPGHRLGGGESACTPDSVPDLAVR
jgi:integrase